MLENSHSDEANAADATPVATKPVAAHQLRQRGRHFKVRNVGIHGARSTGKTCYLACCLYGQSVSENATVILGESPSLGSLQNAWDMLTRGELPQANAVTVPDEIEFSLQADRLRWQVRTQDYAGSLVQLSDTGVSELRQEVREWLVNSDAIFLLVNADLSANAPAARERMSEIEVLLDQLLVNSPDGNTVAKPLALLLTKWDVQGQITGDPAQEEQKSLAYLRCHPVFQQIAQKIEQAGDRVKVFPVSAFGSHCDGNRPPRGGPHPFNLHAPLVWAAQKADEMLYESAKREAKSWAGPERWWKNYSRAIGCYTALIKKAGINKGPVYEQIRADRRPLKKARFKRRCWIATALLTMFAGWLWWHDDHRYAQAARTLDDPALPISEVDATCQPYVDGWNPFADWTGKKQAIRQRLAQRKEEDHKRNLSEDERAYQALVDFRQSHPDDKDAGLRVEACRRFLDQKDGYPASSHRTEVLAWQHEDEATLKENPKYAEFDRAAGELSAAITNLPPTDHDAHIRLYNAFLNRFPKPHLPKRRADIEQVELRRDTALAQKGKREWSIALEKAENALQPRQPGGLPDPEQYEEAIRAVRIYLAQSDPPPYQKEAAEQIEKLAWRKVKDYADKYPRNYDAIVPRVRDYIRRTDVNKTYSSEATALKAEKESEWDRVAFQEVTRKSRPAYEHEIASRKPQDLQEARKEAESYLQSRSDRLGASGSSECKRLEGFWNELERWVEWAKTVETQKAYPYWIEVKSIRIPDGGSYYSTPRIWLTLDISGESASVGWLDGKDITVNKTFGPFQCRWGKKGFIRVQIEERGYLDNSEFEVVIDEGIFVPGRARGVLRVPARNGKEIEVELESWEKIGEKWKCVPPALPDYPSGH